LKLLCLSISIQGGCLNWGKVRPSGSDISLLFVLWGQALPSGKDIGMLFVLWGQALPSGKDIGMLFVLMPFRWIRPDPGG